MERCDQCGKTGDLTNQLRRCSRCMAVHYCSRDCQARHWSKHKATCSLQNEGAAKATSGAATSSTATAQSSSTHPSPRASPSSSSWQQARSRAGSAFPGNRVIDDFSVLKTLDDIKDPFAGLNPATSLRLVNFAQPPPGMKLRSQRLGVAKGVVLVVNLTSQIYNPFRSEWTLQDSKGDNNAVLWFKTEMTSPCPHLFRFDDLQKGHFLCIKDPKVMIQITSDDDDDDVFTTVTVENVSTVRTFSA